MSDIRYKKIGYVAFNVSDLKRSIMFYRDIVGLGLREQTDGMAFFACDHQHHILVLYQSDRPGLRRVGWQLEASQDVERVRRTLEDQGVATYNVDSDEQTILRTSDAFRVQDPGSGLVHEFYGDMVHMAERCCTSLIDIRRLGHVAVCSKDYDQSLTFLTKIGFALSDHMPGFAAWLRAFPNPCHHSLALTVAEENRLHHVNFTVRDIDDFGRGLNRLRANEIPIAFGPGHHEVGDALFLYFQDPDGMTLEYGVGTEEFLEGQERPPRRLEASMELLDLWGGAPDPGLFGAFGPIDADSGNQGIVRES